MKYEMHCSKHHEQNKSSDKQIRILIKGRFEHSQLGFFSFYKQQACPTLKETFKAFQLRGWKQRFYFHQAADQI